MKVKKAKWLGIFMVVAMLVALVPAVASVENDCGTCGEDGVLTVDLIAGQNDVVGTVTVTNDGEKVCVTYALNDEALAEGWLIYETHLYIGDGEFDGVLTRSNWRLGGPYEANPIPGQFPYGDDELDGKESWKFCISLEDLEVETGDCLYIAAHAVIKKVDCVTDEFTPELSWQRSSEENVESFPGRGANWTLEQGFDIVLDPDEVVWDGGTGDQNDLRAGVNPAISYATWIYDSNNGDSHNGYADLRRFQATFDIPDGYSITGGKLASVNDGYGEIIPINDNIYIFMNESLQFWGGTIINVVGPTSFEGMAGALALRGGVSGNRDPAETDGWYIPGTFPAIDDDDFVVGENVLDVFAEEFSLWGAMHELALTLEYEECVWKDQTAWGDGDRFNEKGNWGMFFKYKICEPCVEPVLLNGSFETPVVTTSQGWDIFASETEGLGWIVEWNAVESPYGGLDQPEEAYLELHKGSVIGWFAYEGEQYTELDSDWDGPGGSVTGEPASVNIYQDIETCGQLFTLKYAWSPRPGHEDNKLEVYWNSVLIDTHVASGVGNNNTVWTLATHEDLASNSNSTTRLEFRETGTPDSFGMFLDAVSIEVQE